MANTIIAVFKTSKQASGAVRDLELQGYTPKDISIISGTNDKVATSIEESVESGVATGSVIGGLAGLLAGAGILPALGGLLIGGPIAAVLGATGVVASVVSGAVTGAAAGGLIGALVKLGLSQEDAAYYSERVQSGGYIIAVPTLSSSKKTAKEILAIHEAERVNEIEV